MSRRLEELLDVALRDFRVASQGARGTWSECVNEALLDGGSTASQLSAAIAADPEVGQLLHLHWSMNGMSQPLGPMLARSLIVGAASSARPSEVIRDLRKLAATREASSIGYFPMAGLQVERTASLRDGVALIPWDDEVPALARSFFGGPLEGLIPLNRLSLRPYPTCALRIEQPARQVLFEDLQSTRDMSDWSLSQREDGALAQAVGLCATLLAQAPIAPLGSWYTSGNLAAACLGGSGFLLTPQADNRRLIGSSLQPVLVSPAELAETVGAYLGFTGQAATSLRIGLERVSQSLLSGSMIDRFIDIGIAAEVLLLHEGGASRPKGGITNRLWNRGMRLLGGDEATMDFNACLLKDLYDARSEAVHTGALPAQIEGRGPGDLLRDATRLIASIAQHILRQGGFPDWSLVCPVAGFEWDITMRRARLRT